MKLIMKVYATYDSFIGYTYSLDWTKQLEAPHIYNIAVSETKFSRLVKKHQYDEQALLGALVDEARKLMVEENKLEEQFNYNKLVARIKNYLY